MRKSAREERQVENMRKTYIVSAKRTAIGSFLGGLATVKPKEMGSEVVKALLADANVAPENVDD